MKPKSFDTSLKKGLLAERIIRAELERRGWIVYSPATEGAHAFDMLCIKDKRRAIAIDVKAKSRMNNLAATGVDQRHFEEYARFSERHCMPFWLIFVDEHLQAIYGNRLDVLEQRRTIHGIEYPRVIRTRFGELVRLWPLQSMRMIADLSRNDALQLSALSQRSYAFATALRFPEIPDNCAPSASP